MFPNKMVNKKSKKFKDLITENIIDDIEETNITKYINLLKDKIVIDQFPLKIKIIITSEFTTPMAIDIIESHYSHPVQVILTQNNISTFYESLIDKFEAWIDEFQERGSGFVFRNIKSVKVKKYKYDYQKASSYIPLQFKSINIINVQNKNDNKCFLWSILSKLYPASRDKQRVTKYKEYENKINMKGIEYPVSIKDIPKVEKQNNLSINLFALENQTNKQSLYPVYVSNIESENVVDLLYIESDENTHYCLIKDLDSFMCDKNNHKSFTCRNCLQGFRREETLIKHKEICYDNEYCKTIMPEPGKNILKFTNYHFKNKLPFVIYSDFESYNIPIKSSQPNPNESYINPISKQEINSYGIYVHSDYPEIYKPQYFSYVGDDAIEKYMKKVIKIFKEINYKIFLNEKKEPILNKYEEDEFQEATECYICKKGFEDNKVREHNHLSGKYRGAACQSCNTKEGKATKLIPVFFHNGSNYDFHFLIEELMKYEDEYNKVKILSKNSEEYISIEYGSNYKKLRFLDSFRFMLKGLSDIAKSMDEFPILEKEFDGDISLLKQKGFYPYEYIDSIEKLNENKLPSKDKWYSTLKQENITDEGLQHTHRVWKHYNCKKILDYHNLYLKTDVLILADAFEKFRKFFLKHHEIDPCYCYSAPGLTWQCGLKYTGVELELLTDVDMLQMFERGIRGGFSGVLGPRHVKAFNKYTPNYHDNGNRILDENEMKQCLEILNNGGTLNDFLLEKFLLYLDANNLYGWAMSKKLPTKDFKWEKNPEYYKNIPEGRGCIIECDLEYPDECKFKTRNYPLAPEKMKINKEMLSEYQLNLLGDKPLGKEEKLFLTLYDKKKYIVHHSILKDYIKLGMKVTKVYRTISFEESDWLAKYINFNTEQRTKAKSVFEKDLWKNMNNSFYGKTLENIRGRSEIKLTTNKDEIKKYINKPNFKDTILFNDNFVAIENNVTSVKFNKPIYLGQAILDYSKQLMYNFYYNVVNKLWKNNELVSSDSVLGDTPLILRYKNKTFIEKIENITDEYEYSNNKFYYKPRNIEVWTSKGFSKIKTVIKHETEKEMFRVVTPLGFVDVTEDHSLIKDNNEIIKPKDLTLNTNLLFNNDYKEYLNPPLKKEFLKLEPSTLEEKKAFIEGFFLADGSSGIYQSKWGIKYSWHLNNQDLNLLNKCLEYCRELYPTDFKIIDCMKSSGVYRIIPKGSIKVMAEKFERFYTDKKEKYVPYKILNKGYNYKLFFFRGFYQGDGYKKGNNCEFCFSQKSKITFSCLHYLITSLGYNTNINTRIDKPNIFSLNITQKEQVANVKKIISLGKQKRTVYDLSTESEDFNCGFPLIVHNTDSIFLSIKTKDIYEDMKKILNELDTSDYPENHSLYSDKNLKKIGKFKDELNGKIMNEIVFLRSKAYSFTLTDLASGANESGNKKVEEEKKLKGIGKTTIKKDIKFDDYKDCLFNNKTKMNKMYTLNSNKHEMFVNEVNKISMSPFDDKRYICDDGIDTIPYGMDSLYFT